MKIIIALCVLTFVSITSNAYEYNGDGKFLSTKKYEALYRYRIDFSPILNKDQEQIIGNLPWYGRSYRLGLWFCSDENTVEDSKSTMEFISSEIISIEIFMNDDQLLLYKYEGPLYRRLTENGKTTSSNGFWRIFDKKDRCAKWWIHDAIINLNFADYHYPTKEPYTLNTTSSYLVKLSIDNSLLNFVKTKNGILKFVLQSDGWQ